MPLYRAELLAKKPLRYAALIHDVSQALYLPFDWDDGSYARDRSGCNNHGTIYGATKADGKIGMARSLDGTDDYVDITSPQTALGGALNPGTGSFSISCWLYNPSGIGFMIGKYGDTPIVPMWGFKGDGSELTFRDTAGKEVTFSVTFPSGRWFHFAFVRDKTANRIYAYIDGVRVADVSDTTDNIDNDRPVWIGRHLNVYAGGIIDEPRIYNRALSQDEIRMLMYRRLV